jgi:hypothetical protein
MYKITITKLVENPNYEDEKKSAKTYATILEREYAISDKMINERILETTLTEEEFQAVKKAVLEVM